MLLFKDLNIKQGLDSIILCPHQAIPARLLLSVKTYPENLKKQRHKDGAPGAGVADATYLSGMPGLCPIQIVLVLKLHEPTGHIIPRQIASFA